MRSKKGVESCVEFVFIPWDGSRTANLICEQQLYGYKALWTDSD